MMKKTVPHFNQMTVVAFSDILGFGIGFVALALALTVIALAFGVVALLTWLVASEQRAR